MEHLGSMASRSEVLVGGKFGGEGKGDEVVGAGGDDVVFYFVDVVMAIVFWRIV